MAACRIIILIAAAVFIIPLLFSFSTIDPALLPKFLAWAILVFVLILMISVLKSPSEGRAVKFFSEQRQFRFRVFRARDSVPCLSASPRLCERQNILSRRRGGAEIRTQSFLIFKLPELSAGNCPEHGINSAQAENLTILPSEGGVSTLRPALIRKGNFFPESGLICRAIFPLFLCHLFFSALSLAKATNLSGGVFEWLKIFLSLIFLYAASLIISENRERGIPFLTRSVILAGSLLGLMGLCQYYQLAFTSIPGNHGMYATVAHKNLFASGMFLMLPFVLYGVFRFSGVWKTLSLASATILLLAIALSKTRTVLGAMILSAIFVWPFAKKSAAKFAKSDRMENSPVPQKMLFSIVIICMIVFSGLFYRTHSESYFDSLKERFLLWEKTVRMIRDHPLRGVGLGQWKIVLPLYGQIEKKWQEPDGSFREVLFQRPHNDYLWVCSETGIPGLICYLSVFLMTIFYAFRIMFKSENSDKRIFASLMLFGIVGYMIISFFSFPKERVVHNIFLMLIMACVLSVCHTTFPPSRCSPVPHRIAYLVAIPLLIFSIVFGGIRLSSEIHTKKALSARNAGNWDAVITEVRRANSWCYRMDPFSTPLSWYSGMANFSQGNIPAALGDFKAACQIHPNHIHVLNNLGTCYALSGDYDRADALYEKALAISPQFEEAHKNLEQIRIYEE